jgi:hypothetical protein
MDLALRFESFRKLSLLSLMLAAACTKGPPTQTSAHEVEKPAAEPATQKATKTSTIKKLVETKTSSLAETCAAGFDEALTMIEEQSFPFRIASCLSAIASACPLLSDAVIRAASQASTQPRKKRAQILYDAIKNRLPTDCRAKDPSDSADSLGTQCYKSRPDLSRSLVSDMDAGTFAFFLVVEEELKEKKVYDRKARRILLNLLLTTAMQGEKQKAKKRRTKPRKQKKSR